MGGLQFLAPLFLLGALAVAIPVVLHLYKRRDDPVVPFAAMRFLEELPIEQSRRRRLQDLLLLALRAAALLLLAIGFARPYLASPAQATSGGVTLVAVDVSASMGGEARFARAEAAARQVVDDLPAGEAVGVIAFAGRADVLMEPGPDRDAARATVARLTAGFGPTRYHAAVARALDVIGTRPGRIVLVTDLQGSGWASAGAVALPDRVALEVRDIGPVPPNAGLTGIERTADGVRVQLAATGPARAAEVELLRDGAAIGRQRVALPADGIADAVFAASLPDRGVLTARLATPDGLPADDERWLVLDRRPGLRAVVIAGPGAGQAEAVYVRRALEAAGDPHAWQVEMRPADRIRADADLAGAALAVLVGTSGLDRRGLEALGRFVEQGGGLLVPVGPAVNVDLVAAGLGDRFPRVRVLPASDVAHALVPTEVRHPVFRLFEPDAGAFDAARFTRVAAMATTSPGQVLARFDNGGAALVVQPAGRGRMAVFGSDLSNRWNDLVLQPAFVPWLIETAAWLADSRSAPSILVAGDGSEGGADRPGVVEWTPAGGAGAQSMRVAVNVAAAELDGRRLDEAAFLAQVPRDAQDLAGQPAAARRQEQEQGWWRYGLALMLVGLVVESVIGRRG